MAPNCPNCGAHLNIVLGGDSTNTPAPAVIDSSTDSQTCKQPKDANPPDSPNPGLAEADIQRLKEIMCAPFAAPGKSKQRTMRPVVSKEPGAGAPTDKRSLEVLDNTARKMLAGIRSGNHPSVDTLLEARRSGRSDHMLPGRMELVLEAVGAVAYDMEWTADGPEPKTPRILQPERGCPCDTPVPPLNELRAEWGACTWLFERMLFADYEIPSYPPLGVNNGLPKTSKFVSELSALSQFSRLLTETASFWVTEKSIPTSETWDRIAHVTEGWERSTNVSVWDIATMIHHINIHSQPTSVEGRKETWLSYPGVLHQMKSEVSTRGKARLEGKLSLDVHLLIPKLVRDQKVRAQMISTAQDLAAQYGCQLAPLESHKMPKTPVWRRWFDFLLGRLVSRRGLDDETRSEKKESVRGKGEGY